MCLFNQMPWGQDKTRASSGAGAQRWDTRPKRKNCARYGLVWGVALRRKLVSGFVLALTESAALGLIVLTGGAQPDGAGEVSLSRRADRHYTSGLDPKGGDPSAMWQNAAPPMRKGLHMRLLPDPGSKGASACTPEPLTWRQHSPHGGASTPAPPST